MRRGYSADASHRRDGRQPVALLGVVAGFLVHMFAAAVGLTALFLTVPLAYEPLRWTGAACLLYLAWQALRLATDPRR